MNKVHKSVWNEALGTFVATAETAKGRRKTTTKVLHVAALAAAALAAEANAGTSLGNVDYSGAGGDMAIGDHAYGSSSACPDVTTYGWATAIGYGSTAQGCAVTAIGAGSSAGSASNRTQQIYATAIGPGATASELNTLAIGPFASAIAANSVVIGVNAGVTSTSGHTTIVGNSSKVGANSANSVTVGDSAVIGNNAAGSVAIGNAASVSSSATNAVALGAGSAADRPNVVAMGNATTTRTLSYVSPGTQGSDAANVSQIKPLVSALGGAAKLGSDGSISAPTYSIKGASYSNVGDALAALGDAPTTQKYFNATSSLVDSAATGTDSVAIGGGVTAIGFGNNAIGRNAAATGSKDAIAIGDTVISAADNTVSMGSQITNKAQNSIVLGSNGVSVDAASTQSVLLAPNSGAVTNSANSFSFNPYGGTGTSDSNDSINISGTAAGANGGVTIGSKSSVAANYATALGAAASASASEAVAVGHGATASAAGSVALGASSVADRANTLSVGSATAMRQITNVANGTQSNDAVNVSQLQNVASLLGGGAALNADGTVKAPAYTVAGATVNTVGDAIGKIDSALSVKVAYDSSEKTQVTLGGVGAPGPVKLTNVKAADVSSTSSDAVNGAQLYTTNQNVSTLQTFVNNVNTGGGIKYFHANSTLADSSATGSDAVAIGGAANASAANSVALGSNSLADRANTVSVGASGHERQITNVAAGTQATDAVNLAQLTSVSNGLDTLGGFAVRYDANADGTPDYQTVTLGGKGAAQTTRLTNLSNADLSVTSTDAVNGSQLYATNQNVATLQSFANNINNGGGITYFHSNSTLADSSATGTNSVAIGGAAVASADNAVALGSNSVANRANSVSVGAVGSERQVTNVAAGTAATDAVNVGQLNAVSTTVTSLSASAIKYDTQADGTPDYGNATLGNGSTSGTALHNVAAGTSSMDAVNLGQFNSALARVSDAADNAYNPLFSANGNRDTEVATSSGTHSVASGANAVASGTNAIASGAGATGSGTGAVALGANATASAKNSVALGANSVADRVNSVSVGTSAAGGQRQITNVDAGTQGTDAVNVNQMQQSVATGVKSAKGYTDALRNDVNSGLSLANNHINSVGAMSSAMAMMAGSAAAVADKDNRFAAGTGVYRNKAAIAVGFQKRFGNNMVLTLGGSTTGEESTGGAGFAFGF
jgi:trimeric autotransporter adhesin